jgi:hypothetical protein
MIMKSTIFWDLAQLKFTDVSRLHNAFIFRASNQQQAQHAVQSKVGSNIGLWRS